MMEPQPAANDNPHDPHPYLAYGFRDRLAGSLTLAFLSHETEDVQTLHNLILTRDADWTAMDGVAPGGAAVLIYKNADEGCEILMEGSGLGRFNRFLKLYEVTFLSVFDPRIFGPVGPDDPYIGRIRWRHFTRHDGMAHYTDLDWRDADLVTVTPH